MSERLDPPKSAAAHRWDESYARRLDEQDPLAAWRSRFHFPQRDGRPLLYFAGNSLGLQPHGTREAVEQELDDWARLAVDAHFDGRHPWFPYHEQFRESGAKLVGAQPGEVVFMNGLTVNLHLLMVSFYRPTAQRYKIVIEDGAFPSDAYVAQSQLQVHGFDPADGLLVARPRPGEPTLRTDDIESLIERHAESIALVLFPGVSYFTGQVFEMARIAAAARRCGCVIGFDLAHAAGNVPLQLHDWNVDFAAWCTYKYLNCGPGAVAGCFVHERHTRNASVPRFGGWWGTDPATRFRMHLNETFEPVASADAWQLSNPPILSLAPLRTSLAIFDQLGMAALREKSLRLTGYFQDLLDQMPRERFSVITPRAPAFRGCQLSIAVHDRPRELFDSLHRAGVVGDFRPPNVIRVAPVPLYNSFHDVWTFAQVLRSHLGGA